MSYIFILLISVFYLFEIQKTQKKEKGYLQKILMNKLSSIFETFFSLHDLLHIIKIKNIKIIYMRIFMALDLQYEMKIYIIRANVSI